MATTRTPDQVRRARHITGLAMLAGAVVLGAASVLFYTGMLPVAEEVRGLLAGILATVAALDVLIGVKFLLASQS
ncbi:MAG: hypothetical protein Q8L86_21580 [Vicinamibacterales bacterium]|nr:hypothetical protein [Vicinamibacterales bacterium]